MNYTELSNFLVLADLLHFGKASQACNLSPSALTRGIQRLEDSLEKPLFIRDNRSVKLTRFGEKFRVYANTTLREWQIFCEEVKDDNTVGGHLSIYASVTAAYSLLPNLLEKYRAAYPSVQLQLLTGSPEDSIQKVLEGSVDISFAALPDKEYSQLDFIPLITTELIFVGLKNDPNIPIENGALDLDKAPLVIPSSGLSRTDLDQILKKKNIKPKIEAEVSGNEGILAMVRLGCGVGVVPELVLERSPFRNDLYKIPASVALKAYTVGLCTTRKNLARANIGALWKLAKASAI